MQVEPPQIEASATSSINKECPYCYETIKASAVRCSYCGESIGEFLSLPPATPMWLGWKGLPQWLLQIARWIEWKSEQAVYLFKKLSFFELLDYSSRLTVIVGIIFWLREADDRRFQRINEAWQLLYLSKDIGGDQILSALNALDRDGIAPNRFDLQEFELADLDLSDYNLLGANLTDANLTDADLTGANLTDANLTGANLTDATLYGATLAYATLYGVDFTDADLTDADLTWALLSDADLSGATLTNADLIWVIISDADLSRATLTHADLTDANLSDADLTRTILTDANLTNANLTGANLTGANLTNAVLSGTRYNSSTIWPDGFDPDKAGAIYEEKSLEAKP